MHRIAEKLRKLCPADTTECLLDEGAVKEITAMALPTMQQLIKLNVNIYKLIPLLSTALLLYKWTNLQTWVDLVLFLLFQYPCQLIIAGLLLCVCLATDTRAAELLKVLNNFTNLLIYPETTMLVSPLMVQKQWRAKLLALQRESRQGHKTSPVVIIPFTIDHFEKARFTDAFDKTVKVINFIESHS